MLVETAWSLRRTPGPLGAFVRIRTRCGEQIAAVATARKLAVLIWRLLAKQQDYACVHPALLAFKLRRLELQTGTASCRGSNKRAPARDYGVRAVRGSVARP